MPDSTRIGPRLTLMELFEEVVTAGPMLDEYPAILPDFDPKTGTVIPMPFRDDPEKLAQQQRHDRERCAREWAGLLHHTMELIRRLPHEDIALELGPSPRFRQETALAWAISHFGDELYAKARPDDGIEPESMARELSPGLRFDQFTNVLCGYLIRMTVLGHEERFTMSGLDGTERTPFKPDWFVEGAVVYDPLSNVVVVNGKRFGGIEANFVTNDGKAEAADEDGWWKPDRRPPPKAALDFMIAAEAAAMARHDKARLLKDLEVDTCMAQVKVTRQQANDAFMWAVPRYRWRGRGDRGP